MGNEIFNRISYTELLDFLDVAIFVIEIDGFLEVANSSAKEIFHINKSSNIYNLFPLSVIDSIYKEEEKVVQIQNKYFKLHSKQLVPGIYIVMFRDVTEKEEIQQINGHVIEIATQTIKMLAEEHTLK